MARKKIKYEDKDWRADFDSVRIDQMLDFRENSLYRKFEIMEDLAEFARYVQSLPKTPAKPKSKP